MRLNADFVARCLDLEREGVPCPGGVNDEFPDPVGTVLLTCGHMGVPTIELVSRRDAYWCGECRDYREPKGE